MSDENVSGDANNLVGQPVPIYAPAMVFIGAWGLLLSLLNMFGMAHPTYHISWGGLLTFETTNAAFGDGKGGFHFEPLGDTVFLFFCAVMVAFGSKVIGERMALGDWLKGLLINDTWPALGDLSIGGGQRTFAAWCLLLGLVFYFYYGIQHAGWIDVGVYSVTIALMASGFALNHASRVPPGDENID